MTPDGDLTEFPLDHLNGGQEHAITTGPDGNLWFTETNFINRFTPDGQLTKFLVPGPHVHLVNAITVGPDDNLWFCDDTPGGKVGRITPAGDITEFGVGVNPSGITVGPDGNLWLTERNSNAVGNVTTEVPHRGLPGGAGRRRARPGSMRPWMPIGYGCGRSSRRRSRSSWACFHW